MRFATISWRVVRRTGDSLPFRLPLYTMAKHPASVIASASRDAVATLLARSTRVPRLNYRLTNDAALQFFSISPFRQRRAISEISYLIRAYVDVRSAEKYS